MFYEKKIYSYVVSIVKSDYSKITISHSSANDVLTIYSSTIRSSFTVKSTNTFKKKADTFFTLASYILNLIPLWVTAYYMYTAYTYMLKF